MSALSPDTPVTKPAPRPIPKVVKVLLGLAIGFLVLLFAPVVIGSFLPHDYHGIVEVTLATPPDKVFALLTDKKTLPFTGSYAKTVERKVTPEGLPIWVEDMSDTVVTVTTTKMEPPTLLEESYSDAVIAMNGSSVTTLTPTESGGTTVRSDVKIHIDDKTMREPYFRFMLSFVVGPTGGVKSYLQTVATHFGETVEVRDVEV